jgi:serine/threonine-protein kinase
MPSDTPTVLGPYRIERELGRGGMGIVYLAHDPRLGRRVAIKALPDDVAADPERLARFEREARVLASLNHPNLAAVYDVLEVNGRRYLAMEYVEGESLADRIRREGALPLAEALDLCAQIAAGMDAAHEGGVVHRDLKPANVMITPGERVKIVDFGLAKGRVSGDETPARGHAVSPVLSSSPTLDVPGTMPGVILGTAPYLSPEQARGKVVDRRTDIWSFGCVLYECLTGRALFEGETVSDTIARILERPIDWSPLPKNMPPRVRELLERCLERDPRKRLRDIGEARLVLEEARSNAAAPAVSARKRAPLWRRVGPFLGGAGATILAWHLFGASLIRAVRGPAPKVTHLSIVTPPDLIVQGAMISPDGSVVLARARPRTAPGGSPRDAVLYAKRFDGSNFEPVAGTDRVDRYGFSPDGKWVWFTSKAGLGSEMLLSRVPVDGSSPPVLISPWQPTWSNAALLRSGDLLIGVGTDKYLRVRAGAPPSPPRSFDIAGFGGFVMPIAALPGDRGVLLLTSSYQEGGYQGGIGVLNLRTGKSTMLVQDGGSPAYSRTGHLLFTQRGTLLGVPFDLTRLETRGEPVALMDGLHHTGAWSDAGFALSNDGTLLYRPSAAGDEGRRLVVVDAHGTVSDWSPVRRMFEGSLRVSPDGGTAACVVTNAKRLFEVWTVDSRRAAVRRSAFPEADCAYPFWSPDGKSLGYTRYSQSPDDGIYVQDLNDQSSVRRVGMPSDPDHDFMGNACWSPDGSMIAVNAEKRGGPSDLAVILTSGGSDGRARVLLRTKENEYAPAFSPDGRVISHASDESGKDEVYVRRLLPGPSLGPAVQASVGGGKFSRWSRDGSRLYYDSEDRRIRFVTVRMRPGLEISAPSPLWDLGELRLVNYAWDILPDGRLLGVRLSEEEAELKQFDVVQHFDEEVKRKLGK